jgi:hypothetical protein
MPVYWKQNVGGVPLFYFHYHNPSLGFMTKANAKKGARWKCNLKVTFAFLGM